MIDPKQFVALATTYRSGYDASRHVHAIVLQDGRYCVVSAELPNAARDAAFREFWDAVIQGRKAPS